MPNSKSIDHEIATLKWMIEVYESGGATKSCRFCKMVWLVAFLVSTAFVIVSYKYQLVQVGFLLFGSAVAGATFMATGLFGQSTVSVGIVSQYVDVEAVKRRLNELQV